MAKNPAKDEGGKPLAAHWPIVREILLTAITIYNLTVVPAAIAFGVEWSAASTLVPDIILWITLYHKMRTGYAVEDAAKQVLGDASGKDPKAEAMKRRSSAAAARKRDRAAARERGLGVAVDLVERKSARARGRERERG